jgi:hypothetical protein
MALIPIVSNPTGLLTDNSIQIAGEQRDWRIETGYKEEDEQ